MVYQMQRMVSNVFLQESCEMFRIARQRRGMTQAELADIIGTSQSEVSRIENGGKKSDYAIILKIIYLFDMQICISDGSKSEIRM